MLYMVNFLDTEDCRFNPANTENGSQNRASPNEFTASTNLGRNREPKPIIVNAIEKTNRLD